MLSQGRRCEQGRQCERGEVVCARGTCEWVEVL